MEKDSVANFSNLGHQLTQAEKKIAELQSLCDRRGQLEKAYQNEVLLYHRKTACLEQDIFVASKTLDRLQVMNQEAEKLNKKTRYEYLEACKTISSLEVKNSSLVTREEYLKKQIRSANHIVSQMEKENLAALRKISELQQNQEFLERKRREAVGQVYKLQAKNAELEASLEFYNQRNRYTRSENGKNDCDRRRDSASEFESTEGLVECDYDSTDGGTEIQRKFQHLKREKDIICERLENAENDILEGEKMNTVLRRQVSELKKTLDERDNQVKLHKQLYERARRDSQDEICKLEEAVYHWQSKYDQCLIDMEKESNNREEKKDINVEERHEACWECELRLRACHSELAERDITIAYLQKINESHEDKIRQILNKYKQSDKNEDTFKKGVTARDFSSIPDLHHEIQILLAFYKKRSENAIVELNKWKALAVEARSCREKETSLFESQLSVISKEYCEKYEKCRSLLEEEKTKRATLEGQIRLLIGKLKESEEFERTYLHYIQDSRHRRCLHDSLVKKNSVDNSEHEDVVTQCYERVVCRQNLAMDESVDDYETPLESATGEISKDVTNTEISLKHENRERDVRLENVSAVIDAEKETIVEEPVDSNRFMEHVSNGSNEAMNQNGTVNEGVTKEGSESLPKKNAGLQALWENLTKEKNEAEQTTVVSGEQSSEIMSANCEAHENEIQKLRQDVEDAATRYNALEKTYFDCKAENERLEELVVQLRARITELESKEFFTMANSEVKTDSAKVAEAQNDGLQEIEEALNEGFAAQEAKSPAEMSVDKTTGEAAVVADETSGKQEQPGSPAGKLPGHGGSSLPRKFPSSSTAPMPFKLHTPSSSSHSSASSRQRTRSVDHTSASDRRGSVGSDTNDNVPGDAGNEGKPRFMQKKFSASHLDAFKPKPFKKQTSLADDIHLYSRQRKNSGSKTESTGSASDSDPTHEIPAQAENVETTQQAKDDSDSVPPVGKSPAKEPPHTLPKPQRHAEKSADEPTETTAFQSGFSKKDYYSGIRPQGSEETDQATPPTNSTPENQDNSKETSAPDKGELV